MAHSALREVGNIVASHAVSSVADHIGDTITISVPILVGEAVDDAFGSLLFERRAGSAGIASEIDLCEPAGARRALLVVAPDAV
jgi:chemotaxis protein CheY-P-specific phosphatase CheC